MPIKNLCLLGLIILAIFNPAPAYAQTFIDQPQTKVMIGSRINQIAWQPDGEAFAVATEDGIILFNRLLQQLAVLNPGVATTSLSWQPVGDLLAVTNRNSVQIWQKTSASFKLIATLITPNSQVFVAWQPDGTHLATLEVEEHDSFGGSDLLIGRIRIWNTTNWHLQQSSSDQYIFDRTNSFANVLDWNPQGLPLLLGAGNGGRFQDESIFIETDVIAYIINIETGQRIQEIPLLHSEVLSVAWQPAGTLIAVGSEATVDLYNLTNGEYVDSFAGTNFWVEALDWTADGTRLVSNNMVMDDLQISGYLSNILDVQAVAWSPDGAYLVLGSETGVLGIVTTATVSR